MDKKRSFSKKTSHKAHTEKYFGSCVKPSIAVLRLSDNFGADGLPNADYGW